MSKPTLAALEAALKELEYRIASQELAFDDLVRRLAEKNRQVETLAAEVIRVKKILLEHQWGG